MLDYESAVICAITGASGAPIAIRLLKEMAHLGAQCHVVFSVTGARVFTTETGISADAALLAKAVGADASPLHLYSDNDLFSPLASGSNPWKSMVICPCSMGTAGRIAAGVSGTLITRAADVALKERRPLVLVPREMPMSQLHLENLAKLSGYGALVIPPVLTFYNKLEGVDAQIGHIVGRILVALGYKTSLVQPWMGDEDGL
jgi:flavin prenyltransferase